MEASPRIHAPDGGACILRRDRVLQRQDRASPHLVYVKVDEGEGDAGHDVEPAPAARAAIEPAANSRDVGAVDSQAFCRKKGARLQRRSPRQGSPARRRRRPPRAEAAAATDQKREGDET